MQNINVGRYSNPKATGWAGWIEPEDKSWIAFIGLDGRPVFYLHRDSESGAICPDDPGEREQFIAHLRDPECVPPPKTGNFTGQPHDGTASYDGPVPLKLGEPVFPLGVDGTGGVGVT